MSINAQNKFQLLEPPFDTAQYLNVTQGDLTLNGYNDHLRTSTEFVKTFSGKALHCLANEQPHQGYEIAIYEHGNLPTRENNWHDYFNLCVWLNFPKTKAMINYIQYTEMKNKLQKNRTALENAMTLFDENGLLVLSTDPTLLNLIRQHEWKKLFWDCRDEVLKNLKIIIIGHSMYEKFLNPYVGMTGHAILYEVEDLNLGNNLLDLKIAESLERGLYTSPRDFQPIPVLGYPGWYAKNECETFYDDISYFRAIRSH